MTDELRDLSLQAARELAGSEAAVLDARVIETADSLGRPAYRFTMLVDQSANRLEPGMLRIDLSLRLRDELEKRKDDHFPYISILDRADWDKTAVA